MSWGINFAWKASQALIFGLTVTGVSSHSPVIEGNPMGPFWLTGGGFGLDASWWACIVLLFAFAASIGLRGSWITGITRRFLSRREFRWIWMRRAAPT